jgi:MFS family permease
VLLAFPYGFLSDRVGRKKIILIGMLGCVLSDTWARIVCTLSQAAVSLVAEFEADRDL